MAGKVNALTAETVTRILVGRKQTGRQAFEAWKDWAETVGLTPNTIHRYETYILLFLREQKFETSSLAGAKDSDVDKFVNPVGSGIVANTRRNRLCAMQSFFAVVASKGYVATDISAVIRVKLDGLSFHQKEPKRRVPFTDLELAVLRRIEDPFWRTFVLLGEYYGFRVSDVAQLEWASFDRPGMIIVWTDKRDTRLELPLDPEVSTHMQTLERRGRYVFPEQRATSINVDQRSMLSTYFIRELARHGIVGKSTHCLRHTFATKRAGLGDTVDQIRQKMGHASTATTEIYIHSA